MFSWIPALECSRAGSEAEGSHPLEGVEGVEEGRDQAGVRERSGGGLGIYQGGLFGFQKAKLPTFLIVS